MKNCTDCALAKWERTAAGKLHPSSNGKCKFVYKSPVLPASMHWVGGSTQTPSGGWINRRETLNEHCKLYSKAVV